MFAVGIWDKNKRRLSLACDRMGEKPIYYGRVNGQFVFASELKAIKEFPSFKNPIDHNALTLFLRFNSIPSPYSIYKDIYKLEPGQIVQFNLDSMKQTKYHYWSTEELFKDSQSHQFLGSPLEAINQLDDVLSGAVASQMEADVPLGAFLSGGIDSTTVVALMQAQSSTNINTFSIGFNAEGYDEAQHASKIAKHLGTNHHEMYVTESEALEVIPNLPIIYDEPFADSSQIPTYLVSKFAKQKVTVALSGDAGDELFGGYNRYVFADKVFSKAKKTPLLLRQLISAAIMKITQENWDYLLSRVLGKRFANIGYKLHKTANVLSADSLRDLHFKLISQIQDPSDWLNYSNENKTILNDGIERFSGMHSIQRMMAYDLITYLPNDILTKVDRAAMAVSLETRLPYLDKGVLEFSAALPMEFKIRNGTTKWILREVLYKYVPRDLVNRPKMGFAVPLAEWLRGPLREWAESLLHEKRLYDEGFFNVEFVRTKWLEHLNYKQNYDHQLWNALMFQAWLERN